MAAKKIDIKFDIDSKSVKIAGEETMKLSQQVRLLKAELASGKYSQEEFEILATKLGDVEDQMAKTKTRSGDLLTSLQLIPGPIGEIASKFNGAISLLKQFSSFSLQDLTFQFKETIQDVRDIGTSLFKNLGITKIYTVINNALASSFVAVGVGEQAAAVGARAFAAALTTTGIGAIVVALGFLVSTLIEYVTSTEDATAANEALNATIKEQNRLFEVNLKAIDSDIKLQTARAKAAGASEKELFTIQQQGGKSRLEELRRQDAELFKRGQEIAKNDKISAEEKKKLIEENGQKELALNQQIIDQINADEIARLEFEGQINRQREQERQKNIANTKAAGEKELAEIQKIKDEAAAIQLEAELSLLDLQEREITERTTRFNNELAKLKKAGYTDFTALEEEYRKDIEVIDEKYNKERIQRQKDVDNQLKTLEASRTETLLDDSQVEIEIVKQKYAALLSEAEKNKEDTVKIKELEKAEIAKIEESAAKAEIERIANDALAANETKLRLLELEGQALVKGTKSYAENRAEILRLTEESSLLELKKQLDLGKLTREQYEMEVTATEEKYTQLRKDLKQQEIAALGQSISASIDAFASLGNAIAASYDEEAKTSKSAFEKRKKLQVATALMSAASGLIQILTQPSTLLSPFDVIVKTANALALGVATKLNIDKIKSVNFNAGGDDKTKPAAAAAPTGVVARRAQGGFVYGDGGSMTDSIPAMLSNGEFVMNAKSAAMFSPMLTAMNDVGNLPNTSIPQSLGNQSLVDVMSQSVNNRPIKTYVTAQDMSNQQQFDRTIKSRSLI